MANKRNLNLKSGSGVPNKDQMTNQVKSIAEIEPTPKKTGRPKKSGDRVKLTTAIESEYKTQLRIMAAKRGVQFADLLNEAIEAYLKAHQDK